MAITTPNQLPKTEISVRAGTSQGCGSQGDMAPKLDHIDDQSRRKGVVIWLINNTKANSNAAPIAFKR